MQELTGASLVDAAGREARASGIRIADPSATAGASALLSPGALALVARLERRMRDRRRELLDARVLRQREYDAGALPGYLVPDVLPDAHGDWRIEPLPPDLMRRRVEITGPISDPKMVINMLSRGDDGARADAAMLDFEDSMKPSWPNVLQGFVNLAGAVDGTLRHVKTDARGRAAKTYELDPADMPLLMVRVRGLHLDEVNVEVDGRPVAAGLFDLAVSAFLTAGPLIAQGKTPKYYVPKVEHHLEARWWNELLTALEDELGMPSSTLRATLLIETLPAAFQTEEILWELRDHVAGLNVGRWDKIFSDIKVLMRHGDRILADRGSISLNRPWMRDYALRLIRICHRHGAFAMGGMAAFTPGRSQHEREEQTRKVVEDKRFEASIGHDGCWVSHPYFIAPALQPFESDNQLDVIPDIEDRPDLLPAGTGPRTIEGLRRNVRVGIAYMRGWNQDIGCVAWDNLMEDLATLEISRAQVQQWLHHAVTLDGGESVTPGLVRSIFDEELGRIEGDIIASGEQVADVGHELELWRDAAHDARAIFTEKAFRPFLTCRSEAAGEARERLRHELRDGSGCRAD